jgi:serine/threonine-protein kinase
MGEVWRARDTRLGREVAIKVLPEAVASDPSRAARFQREATLLAALNHPAIATVHGFEQADGVSLLVLELVDGPTLAERLHRGPLPVREALEVARQIAEALGAAHEKGIIHRDLKPSNVKLTKDGRVKLLDFGLAKALGSENAAADVSKLSTETSATDAGVVLGTAPYMSPEQARGVAVDERADVWAFGCVLFEMLAGKRAFAGSTGADVVSAILGAEPDWPALPDDVPPMARSLLRRCLQKDRPMRLRAIADARLELDEVLATPAGETTRGAALADRRLLARLASVALVALLAAAVTSWLWTRPVRGPAYAPIRLNVDVPPSERLPTSDNPPPLAVISPDGRNLVYHVEGKGLYVRPLGGVETRPLVRGYQPSFSPDGEWVAFSRDGKLWKVPITGGAPRAIAEASNLRGASWGEDGTIVFAPTPGSGLFRVSAEGGTPQKLTELALADGSHRWPQVLPGGDVLYTVFPRSSRIEDARIVALSAASGSRKVVVEGGTYGRYVPTGHVVYGSRGTAYAVPFDRRRLERTGPGVPVLKDVRMAVETGTGTMLLEFSRTGLAVYVTPYPRLPERKLFWVDRKGSAAPLPSGPRPYWDNARVSRDGRRVVASIAEANATDLWVYDIPRQTWTQLTFGKNNQEPVWAPTSDRIAFSSNRDGDFNLFWIAIDGTSAQRLTDKRTRFDASDWSPDGRVLIYEEQGPETHWDIWELRLWGDRRPRPLLVTPAWEAGGKLSPDGRWLAYSSNESGRHEVYVRPYPAMDRKWVVSTQGGRRPIWSHTGRELFYVEDDKTIMAAPVTAGKTFQAGLPAAAYRGQDAFSGFDVAPDGQRLLITQDVAKEPERLQIVVIPNWFEELKANVPPSRR